MDLLASLRSLIGVAETGSFSEVARRNGSSQSAITRRIGDLEEHFGVRLLHRTTRRLSLTPDGEEVLEHARHLLDMTEDMETAIGSHRKSPIGLVRVGAPVGVGEYFASNLPRLLAMHPGLSVELVLTDEEVDLVAGRLDVAIRFRPLEDSSLVVRQVGETGWLAVASPAYLEAHGHPQRPEDLAGHNCLVHTANRTGIWHFTGPDGPIEVHVNGQLSANVVDALRRPALNGYGIALLPRIVVADDVAAGRLVQVMPSYDGPMNPIYLIMPSRRHLPPRNRVVMDFIVELAQAFRT